NNFPRAEGTISELALNHLPGTPLRFNAPHNTYLQVAAAMGVPPLLLWCSIIWYGTIVLRRSRSRLLPSWRFDHGDRGFLYAACTFIPIAFLGFAVTSAFLSFAYLSPFYILATYAAAAGYFADRELRKYDQSMTQRPSTRQGTLFQGQVAGVSRRR